MECTFGGRCVQGWGCPPDPVRQPKLPVTWEPGGKCFPKLWPKDGWIESLLSTGINNRVAGNKNAGGCSRILLVRKAPPSASSKNQTQPGDVKDSGRPAPRHHLWQEISDKLRKQSEIHFLSQTSQSETHSPTS